MKKQVSQTTKEYTLIHPGNTDTDNDNMILNIF